MSEASRSNVALWAEAFRTLIGPSLLLLAAISMLIFDNIVDPPGDPQGTSGIACIIVSVSLGLGFDKLKGRF